MINRSIKKSPKIDEIEQKSNINFGRKPHYETSHHIMLYLNINTRLANLNASNNNNNNKKQ